MAFTSDMALPDAGTLVERGPDHTEEVPSVAPAGPPTRRPSRRAIVVTVAVVVLAGGGTALGLWYTSGSGTPSSGATTTTRVVSVTTGTMQQTVTSSGTLEPSQTADLDFAVPGTVTAVDVTTGQQVRAGQALATVGATALQDQLSAAQESLDAAEARLSEDQSAGAATSQLDSDQAAVTSAQNDLATAQTALDEATLTSTINGTVASVALSVGQQVSGSGGTGTGGTGTGTGGTGTGGTGTGSSAQVVVVSSNSFVVSTTVDDTQVGQVKNGDQAVIVPSGSTTDVYGTVASVGLIASSSSGVASFPVTIAVTGSPSGLYAGTSASVSIVVQQIDNAVQVPSAALSYANGQATVTQVVGGRHVTRDVTTGISANGETQVTSGVSAGDKVLEQVVTFRAPSGSSGSSLFGGRRFPGGGAFGGGGGFGGAFGGGGFGGGGAVGGPGG